jgi:MFS family permease
MDTGTGVRILPPPRIRGAVALLKSDSPILNLALSETNGTLVRGCQFHNPRTPLQGASLAPSSIRPYNPRLMRLWRYCIAGLLFNLLAFIFWTVVPIRAVTFGASSTELALLQTASTIVYVINSLIMGRLSDRVSRSFLARIACAIAIAACGVAVQVDSLGFLYLVVPMMGLAGSVYWPSAQGAVGAETDPSRVEKTIGWFNVSWSIGKTLGFIFAGWLIAVQGSTRTLWIATASALPILLLYPRDRTAPKEAPPESGHPDRTAFRTIGYIANFLAFGVGAVFQNQFFKYLQHSGLGGGWEPQTFFGVFLGAIYAAQTVLFTVLQRGSGWTYRRGLLYGAQLLTGGAAAGVTLLSGDAPILAAAGVVGVGLGFANASSIYYSLHGPSDHGKYAGVHEAVLGAGTILVPLAGGALADLSRELRMPYWLAGAAMLGAVGIEEFVYRRRSRS